MAAHQASGSLPWIGVGDPSDVQRRNSQLPVRWPGEAHWGQRPP